MRTLTALLFLVFVRCGPALQAQGTDLQVFASAGLATGHQTFTIGETFVAYHLAGNTLVTEGFHQLASPFVAVSEPLPGLGLEVFPNPTLQDATLRATRAYEYPLTVRLIDLHGRILWSSSLPAGEVTLRLPLSQLASAVYFLRVTGPSGQDAHHLRIEKIAY